MRHWWRWLDLALVNVSAIHWPHSTLAAFCAGLFDMAAGCRWLIGRSTTAELEDMRNKCKGAR